MLPLQPAEGIRQEGEGKQKENKINFCKREKDCYLCNPQGKEGKRGREAERKFKFNFCKREKDYYLCNPQGKEGKPKAQGLRKKIQRLKVR